MVARAAAIIAEIRHRRGVTYGLKRVRVMAVDLEQAAAVVDELTNKES